MTNKSVKKVIKVQSVKYKQQGLFLPTRLFLLLLIADAVVDSSTRQQQQQQQSTFYNEPVKKLKGIVISHNVT
jgi:hypothetical protein